MKIGFATDTNILEKMNNNGKTLDVTDIYTQYIDALKRTASAHELVYYMPEIVVEELLNQREATFNNTYKNFEEKYNDNLYGLLGELPKNIIKEKLNEEREEYNSKYKLIKLEYTSDLMKTLTEEALIKKAPFDKTICGGKTDAGFKDALIWKTLLLSTEVDKCDEFLFYTADAAFEAGKDELEKEFKAKHPNTKINIVHVKTDNEHRQRILNEIIEKYGLQKTDVIELYNNSFVLNFIFKSSYIPSVLDYYYENLTTVRLLGILFRDFDCDDFYIDRVEKTENIFNIYCRFKTLKYNTDIVIENRRYIEGDIKLVVKKENDKYIYVSSLVSNITIDSGLSNALTGLTTGLANLGNELAKLSLNNQYIGISDTISQTALKSYNNIKSATQIALDNSAGMNAINGLKKAIEKQNDQIIKLNSMANELKDIKISESLDFTNKIDKGDKNN